MARTRMLSEVLSAIRVRSDTAGQLARWPDSDLIERVNQSYADLWDEIAGARGHEHFLSTFDITTSANVAQYPLASDFYEMLDVKWLLGAELLELEPFELHDMIGQYEDVWPVGPRPRWRVVGTDPATNISQVMFDPLPSASGNRIRTYYVPHAPTFATNGADNSKLINTFNGYDNFVVWDVAAQLIEEEERDASTALRRREEQRTRIMNMAPHRNAGGPEYINAGRQYRRTYAWGTW